MRTFIFRSGDRRFRIPFWHFPTRYMDANRWGDYRNGCNVKSWGLAKGLAR